MNTVVFCIPRFDFVRCPYFLKLFHISNICHCNDLAFSYNANSISVANSDALSFAQKQIPCTQDVYFSPEDNAIEASHIMNAELRPIDSPFGHCAANPGNDSGFEASLERAIGDLLET